MVELYTLFLRFAICCTMAEIFERYAAQSASNIKPCAKHCLDLLESCIGGLSTQIYPQRLPKTLDKLTARWRRYLSDMPPFLSASRSHQKSCPPFEAVVLEFAVARASAKQLVDFGNIRCEAWNPDRYEIKPAPYKALDAMAEFVSNGYGVGAFLRQEYEREYRNAIHRTSVIGHIPYDSLRRLAAHAGLPY